MKKLIHLICTFLILFAAVSSSVGQDGLTDNYLVKYASGGLRSSIIFEHPNSSFIGIGTNNPNFEFTINGNLGLNNSIYIDDWGSMVIGRRDASVTHFDFQMQGPGSEYNPVLTLLGDKFVGIGNTNPTHSLHVIGDLLIELSIAGDSPVFYTGLDGFIGMGNKNPQSRLDVSGNILLEEILEFRGIENSIRCASGNLNFNVAGQNAVEIASNGNVGIGYSNPVHKLMVAGTTVTEGFVMETNAAEGRILMSDNGGFASWIDQDMIDDGDWVTSVSGSNLYYLLGNIGIGTADPLSDLHVEGNIYASENIGIGTADPLSDLHVEGNIYASENIGIGTADPLSDLHVEGNIYTSEKIGIGIVNPTANLHVEGNSFLNGDLEIGATASTAMLHVAGNSYFGDNVGIGYSNPAVKLHVNGDVIIGTDVDTPEGFNLFVEEGIITGKVKVKLVEEWSDYVFDNDYVLNEIEEVETYIKTHKHLPDVPSAKEVKEDGIDLGQMDAILLKKIEELTLYVIQQQKEIEALRQKIDQTNNK